MTNDLKNTKRIITVWGNPGAGKSTVTAQLAVALAQRDESKILVLDFNTLNPSLDHCFGISKEPENISYKINGKDEAVYNTSLSYAYDAIERGIFESNILKEIVIRHPKYKNLYILTGNYLLNAFEMFNSNHFNAIIECAKKVFDIVIIDTNSVIFVDSTFVSLYNADIIYGVTEGDYTSLRNINNSISHISTQVPKEKYQIIINKYTKNHLDKITISQILDGYKIGEYFEYNEKHIRSRVEKKLFLDICSSKDKKKYIELSEKIK